MKFKKPRRIRNQKLAHFYCQWNTNLMKTPLHIDFIRVGRIVVVDHFRSNVGWRAAVRFHCPPHTSALRQTEIRQLKTVFEFRVKKRSYLHYGVIVLAHAEDVLRLNVSKN